MRFVLFYSDVESFNYFTDRIVEELNKKIPGYVTGRLSNNSVVHFEGCKELIGKIVDVNLKEAKGFYYMGEMVK